MKFLQKTLSIAACLFCLTHSVYSQDLNDEELLRLISGSQYALADYVNGMPEVRDGAWKKVEVLIDFGSKPTRILAFLFPKVGNPAVIEMSGAPLEIWQNFFELHSMGGVLVPKVIQMTVCRGMTQEFPMAVHYEPVTYAGHSLSDVLSSEDQLEIAGALTDDCS